MEITFWFDPVCPWCWITSRWMTDVAPQRDADVTLRPFSLAVKNAGNDDEVNPVGHQVGHRALRVVVAAEQEVGPHAVAPLYTALGTAYHVDGDRELADLRQVVGDAGLPPELADAADDSGHDDVIAQSMAEALHAAGDDVGVPLIRFGPAPAPAFFGPVITPKPTGQAALGLFDGMLTIAEAGGGGFYELKRTRDQGPDVASTA